MSYETVSAQELPGLIKEGHTVIDVRTPSEFRAEHVVGAELNPLDMLDGKTFTEQHDPSLPVYILCQSGKRATMAAEKLFGAGHQNVFVVEGGTNAAKSAGVDMEYGEGGISIDRQFRIAAGSMIVAGAVAGLTIHPGFSAVPIFVGCGMIFAGITDTCGMGMLLAKMPWNR